MPGPAGGIVSRAVFGDRRPGEDALDSAPNARCCLGRLVPDRLEDLPDEASIDRRDRQVIDDSRRGRVYALAALRLIECRRPLGGVFVVFPTVAIGLDVGVGALLERHRLGGRGVTLAAFGVAVLAGVGAIGE